MSESEIVKTDAAITVKPQNALEVSDRVLESRRAAVNHIALPLLLLFVALIGGVRFSGNDGSVLFVAPALICLVFAAALMILFFRASLVRVDGWVSGWRPHWSSET